MNTKMSKLTTLTLLTAILFAVGCTTIQVNKTAKGIYEPTLPASVEIKAIVPADRPFEEIGLIHGDIYGNNPSSAYNDMRIKAAAVGGDAIVISNQMMLGGRTILNGAVIKYKD